VNRFGATPKVDLQARKQKNQAKKSTCSVGAAVLGLQRGLGGDDTTREGKKMGLCIPTPAYFSDSAACTINKKWRVTAAAGITTIFFTFIHQHSVAGKRKLATPA